MVIWSKLLSEQQQQQRQFLLTSTNFGGYFLGSISRYLYKKTIFLSCENLGFWTAFPFWNLKGLKFQTFIKHCYEILCIGVQCSL